MRRTRSQQDEEMARTLQAEEQQGCAPPEDPGLECGCCFDSYDSTKMVQCDMGHLFCCGCLESHAKEQLFGKGASSINCMFCQGDQQCPGQFPESQLIRSLGNTFEAFSKRQALNSVEMAALPNMVCCGAVAGLS